jgi:hypothetical protein
MRELLYDEENTMDAAVEQCKECMMMGGHGIDCKSVPDNHIQEMGEHGSPWWVKAPDTLLSRVKYLEDEYTIIKKTFADLVPVLDAIIESQKMVEGQLKFLMKPENKPRIIS